MKQSFGQRAVEAPEAGAKSRVETAGEAALRVARAEGSAAEPEGVECWQAQRVPAWATRCSSWAATYAAHPTRRRAYGVRRVLGARAGLRELCAAALLPGVPRGGRALAPAGLTAVARPPALRLLSATTRTRAACSAASRCAACAPPLGPPGALSALCRTSNHRFRPRHLLQTAT